MLLRAPDFLRDQKLRVHRRSFFVGQRQHLLDPARLLDRVQILSLQILDQHHLQRIRVADLAHDDRHRFQPHLLRGPVAALAGDDLVFEAARHIARARGPCQQRIHHALRLDALRHLGELRLVKGRAGIQRARHHFGKRHAQDFFFVRLVVHLLDGFLGLDFAGDFFRGRFRFRAASSFSSSRLRLFFPPSRFTFPFCASA